MKIYKRSEFLKLPEGTIFTKFNQNDNRLYCKTTSFECMDTDWGEQDLITEIDIPLHKYDNIEQLEHFDTDLNLCGRNGMFNDEDKFIVWDKKDITKLRDYLTHVLTIS